MTDKQNHRYRLRLNKDMKDALSNLAYQNKNSFVSEVMGRISCYSELDDDVLPAVPKELSGGESTHTLIRIPMEIYSPIEKFSKTKGVSVNSEIIRRMLVSGLYDDYLDLVDKQSQALQFAKNKVKQDAANYNSLVAGTKQEVELLLNYRRLDDKQKAALVTLIKTIKKLD